MEVTLCEFEVEEFPQGEERSYYEVRWKHVRSELLSGSELNLVKAVVLWNWAGHVPRSAAQKVKWWWRWQALNTARWDLGGERGFSIVRGTWIGRGKSMSMMIHLRETSQFKYISGRIVWFWNQVKIIVRSSMREMWHERMWQMQTQARLTESDIRVKEVEWEWTIGMRI